MSLSRTLLLGFIAGVTILLGLPLARLRRPVPGLRVFLNATAVGVLVFLVWDVFSAAWEPIDAALTAVHEGNGGLGPVAGYGALFTAGLAVGLLGLVGYEAWMRRRDATARHRFGPGAMAAEELTARRAGAGTSPARRLALLIAVGIGLHNFAEGLAIGQSAAAGEIALATLLVVGFGLHNATEGFGIVAPLAAADQAEGGKERPAGPGYVGVGGQGGDNAEPFGGVVQAESDHEQGGQGNLARCGGLADRETLGEVVQPDADRDQQGLSLIHIS